MDGAPRLCVVEWNVRGWAEVLDGWLTATLGSPVEKAERFTVISGSPAPGFDAPQKAPVDLVVLVSPPPGDIERLADWLEAQRGCIARLVIAVVDCRVDDLDAIVEPVRRLPRWPKAWFQPAPAPWSVDFRPPGPPCPTSSMPCRRTPEWASRRA